MLVCSPRPYIFAPIPSIAKSFIMQFTSATLYPYWLLHNEDMAEKWHASHCVHCSVSLYVKLIVMFRNQECVDFSFVLQWFLDMLAKVNLFMKINVLHHASLYHLYL